MELLKDFMGNSIKLNFLSLICVLYPIMGSATDAPILKMDVVSGRALEACLQEIEGTHGCAITYEDPAFGTACMYREMFSGGPKIPVTSRIEFSYSVSDEAPAVIQRLVDTYNAEHGGKVFALLKYDPDPTIFNVVPVNERDASGRMAPAQSVLSPSISFNVPPTELTQDILDQICVKVSRQGWHCGLMGGKLRSQVPFGLAATNRETRLCIDDLLSAYNANNAVKLSCSVRKDPSSSPPALILRRVSPATTNQCSIVVEEEHPLAVITRILEQRLGCTITYEDPIMLCPCDVMRNRAGEPEVPSGGIMKCSYTTSDDPLVILGSLVHNTSLGTFNVVEAGSRMYCVYPARSKDANGQLQDVHPLSLIEITLPPDKQGVRQILDQICHDLTSLTSNRVVVGHIPKDLPTHVTGTPRKVTQPLHAALTAFVESIDKNLTWQLLYDPKNRSYNLNVYRIGDLSSLY